MGQEEEEEREYGGSRVWRRSDVGWVRTQKEDTESEYGGSKEGGERAEGV